MKIMTVGSHVAVLNELGKELSEIFRGVKSLRKPTL